MIRSTAVVMFIAWGVASCAQAQLLAPNQTLFVKEGAGGSHVGTQANPFDNLDDALAAVSSTSKTYIYIAEGTYAPNEPVGSPDSDNTFVIEDNTHLVGGWDGSTTTPLVVDPISYEAVLDGFQDNGMSTANSFHVVTVPAMAVGTQSVFGCTIQRGQADGSGSDQFGSGVINYGDTLVLDTCVFESNDADLLGGAIYNGYSAATYVYACEFSDNSALLGGAAIANGDLAFGDSGSGYLEVWDSTFSENIGGTYGALYTGESSDTSEAANETLVINCRFDLNYGKRGGAIATSLADGTGRMPIVAVYSSQLFLNSAEVGGGMYVGTGWSTYHPQVDIVNTSFCDNAAGASLGSGGGLHVGDPSGSGDSSGDRVDVTVTNCTFHESSANAGGGIFANQTSVVVANSILWENTATTYSQIGPVGTMGDPEPEVYYSDVDGGWSGTGAGTCIDEDPGFGAYASCEVPITDEDVEDEAVESFLPFDVFDIDGDSNTTERLPDLLLMDRVVNGTPDMGAREIQ